MQLAQLGILSSNIISERLSLAGITNIFALGDSITVGQNASPSSNAYINLIKSIYGISTITNSASGGRGAWYAADRINHAGFTRASTLITVMAGLNDIRRNGSAAKTLAKIEATYRSIILRGISDANSAGGSVGVTRSGGTFTGYAADTLGGLYGTGTLPGNFACSVAIGTHPAAQYSYTFTGTAFGVQFSADDGVISNYATAEIRIDGVLVKTVNLDTYYDGVSDGTYDNARGPVAFSFHNLANTSHTVVITGETGSGFGLPVDYFCTILPPATAASFLFFEIPYLNSTGYALSPALGSEAASDAASAVIESIVDEYKSYGYNIAYVRTNDIYNLLTGLDTDNIHPNNTGHTQIRMAASEVLNQ